MLSDWTENLMTLTLLLLYPDISRATVAVESVCTTLKLIFLGLSLISAIVLWKWSDKKIAGLNLS